MKPSVVIEFEGVPKDDVYLISKAENRVATMIMRKHGLPPIRLLLEATGKGNYADLKKLEVHIDCSSPTVRKALRENVLDGLLAHETMHLFLLQSGEDGKVNEAVSKAVGAREERVLGICKKYEGGKYCTDAIQVMITLGLVLKDLLNDEFVIKAGLGQELYEYYMSTITTKLEAEKRELGDLESEEVENLFMAMVGVMAAWVSFYRNHMPEEGARIRSEMFKRLSDIPTPVRLAVNRLADKMVAVDPRDEGQVDELVGLVLDAFEEVLSKKSAHDRHNAKSPTEP